MNKPGLRWQGRARAVTSRDARGLCPRGGQARAATSTSTCARASAATARATCTPWLRGLRQHEQARAALARASAGCDDAGRAGAVPTRGKPGLRVLVRRGHTSGMHMYRVAPRAACKRGLLVRVHGRLRLRHGLHVLHGCGGCADMSKLGLRWQGRGLCPRGGQARAATSTCARASASTSRATCTPWLRGLRRHEQARAVLPRASGGCDDTNARGLCQHGGQARASCTSSAWPHERHVHVPRGSAGCMYVRPSCGGAAGATHGRLRPCVASSGAGVGRRGAAEGQPECACVARLRSSRSAPAWRG